MKPRKKTEQLQIFLAVLLLLLSVYFYLESARWKDYALSLEDENSRLNDTLATTEGLLAQEKAHSSSLSSELQMTKQDLEDTESSLAQCSSDLAGKSQQLDVCLSRNEELRAFLLETSAELENLSSELAAFQDQIEQSMAWFTENSNIENLSASLRYQVDKCTSNTEINAPCIPIVMKEEKQWAYKREEGDRLLSLDEIATGRGGDCEDWSLYFKAAYNYLKEEDRPERYIVSAVPGTGNFEIYKDHYYADTEGRDVGTTKDKVYIICYDSHCVVAVSGEEINTAEDVYKLSGAQAIEPQNGQYVFTIGNLLAPDMCSPEICPYTGYAYPHIWIVITDNDIYDFHYNQRWVGYSDYYNISDHYRSRIDAMRSLIEETTG